MYVCLCNGITDADVREAGRAGCVTPCQLRAHFRLKEKGCCGRCARNVRQLAQIASHAVVSSPCDSVER
jgi:bacterioferritin-associated ferredoxin